MRGWIAVFLTLAALSAAAQAASMHRMRHDQALRQITPSAGRVMTGTFPGGKSGDEDDITPADVDSLEKTIGRKVSWVMFSNNWFRSPRFPAKTAGWIRARGAIPYIRLMLRSDTREDHREPRYTLRAIAAGRFDNALRAWGRAAARFGTPIICEYGTEMNGRWFPWNGVWNGGRRGPARFARAYRHIIDVIRGQGASNVIWVFHVNHEDDPPRRWNRFEAYYPGDAYIDWLGVSIYSALDPRQRERTDFAASLTRNMKRFSRMAPGKPVIIAEMGSDVRNRHENAARWADGALKLILSGRWKSLIGFAWWNERWPNGDNPANDTDLRIQDSAPLRDVFRKHMRNPRLWP